MKKSVGPTLFILHVLSLANRYASKEQRSPAITLFILGSDVGRQEISNYAGTHLRIACNLRSREIFE